MKQLISSSLTILPIFLALNPLKELIWFSAMGLKGEKTNFLSFNTSFKSLIITSLTLLLLR